MITIQILGLDPYVVGHYSKDHSANLAQLFEVEEDELSFYAHAGMMFHFGVEQTSWDTLVIVRAPEEAHPLEEAVTDYLFKTLSQFSINLTVQFNYFEREHSHTKINEQYPRFIGPDQINPDEYNDDEEYYSEEEEEVELEEHDHDHEHHHHHHEEEIDIKDEESIYLGNAFEGFEEALDKAYAEKKN